MKAGTPEGSVVVPGELESVAKLVSNQVVQSNIKVLNSMWALPCLGLDHPSGSMQVSHEERMEMEGEVTMPFVISTAFLIRTLEVQTLG